MSNAKKYRRLDRVLVITKLAATVAVPIGVGAVVKGVTSRYAPSVDSSTFSKASYKFGEYFLVGLLGYQSSKFVETQIDEIGEGLKTALDTAESVQIVVNNSKESNG